MKGPTAEETTPILLDIAADSGVPDEIYHDQGSNFTAEHTAHYLKAMGVTPKLASPQAPWSNGAAEAVVKIAKAIIAKLVEERRKAWASILWMARLVMRSREVMGWKITPFEARFARKMRTPAMFGLPFEDKGLPEGEEWRRLKKKLEVRREEVAEEMKRKFDAGLKEVHFGKGDLVWLISRLPEDSLAPKKEGPFKVNEVTGPVNVRLEQVEGGPTLGRRKEIFSVRNLEKYDHKTVYRQKELVVKSILGHEGNGRGRKYKVFWEDDSISMEPRKQLVDKEIDGKETVNEELINYWKRNPGLSRKV